jgi:hypothetical protein
VAVHGELRGQKRFAFRPPLVVPAIMQLRRVMALGHIEDGAMERSCAKGRKRLYLVTKEDMHGLEASGLTRRSHGHRLEHSWVSGLILIPMKVVNGNGVVVETSSHPINGKHGEKGCGGRLSIQSFLVDGFSCKTHN